MKKYLVALALGLSLVLPLSLSSQVLVGVQSPVIVVRGELVQPACPYGYYDYSPYSCADQGFYGPGYFYNGVFLGVGPWYGWGYNHGWGDHRFYGHGGGIYVGNVRKSSHGRSEMESHNKSHNRESHSHK